MRLPFRLYKSVLCAQTVARKQLELLAVAKLLKSVFPAEELVLVILRFSASRRSTTIATKPARCS
jgi:hypothetical protein